MTGIDRPVELTDWPNEVVTFLGTVNNVWIPAQGVTSTVYAVETARGNYAVKLAKGTLYSGWLAREYNVLSSLAATQIQTPRPHVYTRRDTALVPEGWLVMDFVPGQTLSNVLQQTVDLLTRGILLHDFGHALAELHSTPAPKGLPVSGADWLGEKLDEASENLDRYKVDGTAELLAQLRQDRLAAITPALIHGDCTIDNVLVGGSRISSFIDWAGGAMGDRRYDLALATRPRREAFSARRASDLRAFYEGYGAASITQSEYDYFNRLYEFF